MASELVPQLVEVCLDFDGTVTQADVLDDLVARFAVDDSWKTVEAQWQAGQIGSYECLRQEFSLLRITPDQLDKFLDGVRLDPGVGRLFQLFVDYGVPVTILSDGVDCFIRKILERSGIRNVAVRANAMIQRGDRLELLCPHRDAACQVAAAHCKCHSARDLHQSGRRVIYIGDGRSDLCPARKVDLIFAKGTLAAHLALEGVPFIPFATLGEVSAILSSVWANCSIPDETGCQCRGGKR
jgi:2,3-diketo-5-methylthio-1-phosphopentane phosphatase